MSHLNEKRTEERIQSEGYLSVTSDKNKPSISAKVCNISPSGMQIITDLPVSYGDTVTATLHIKDNHSDVIHLLNIWSKVCYFSLTDKNDFGKYRLGLHFISWEGCKEQYDLCYQELLDLKDAISNYRQFTRIQ